MTMFRFCGQYGNQNKQINHDKGNLEKLVAFMPFDFAQESVRQAHHERN